MGKDIVRRYKASRPSLREDFLCKRRGEKTGDRLKTLSAGGACNLPGGVHTQDAHPRLLIEPKQGPVVASDLENKISGTKPIAGNGVF